MSQSSPFVDLRKEHEILLSDIKDLAGSLRTARGPSAQTVEDRLQTLANQLDMFTRGLLLHFRREEEGLYPDAQHMIAEGAGPADVMGRFFAEEGEDDLAAHVTLGTRAQEMIDLVQDMRQAGSPGDDDFRRLAALVQLTSALLDRHAAKEDTLIFPMIERALSPEQVDAVRDRLRAFQSGEYLTASDADLRGLGSDRQ